MFDYFGERIQNNTYPKGWDGYMRREVSVCLCGVRPEPATTWNVLKPLTIFCRPCPCDGKNSRVRHRRQYLVETEYTQYRHRIHSVQTEYTQYRKEYTIVNDTVKPHFKVSNATTFQLRSPMNPWLVPNYSKINLPYHVANWVIFIWPQSRGDLNSEV